MRPDRDPSQIGRREMLVASLQGAALAGWLASGSALAQDKPPAAPAAAPADLDAALKSIMGDAKPVEGKITLDMPEIAENGNTVPFTVSVESPMTEKDYVKAIHVLAAGNPQPGVASFQLAPASGRAFASSRMRLAKTQDVVAVAEMSDGRFLVGKRTVKVTIGGCGG